MTSWSVTITSVREPALASCTATIDVVIRLPPCAIVIHIKPLFPQLPVIRDPALGNLQCPWFEPAPALASALLARHETGCLQHGQMLMHRRERHRERFRKLAERRLAARKADEHRASTRVSEGFEHRIQPRFILRHVLKYRSGR